MWRQVSCLVLVQQLSVEEFLYSDPGTKPHVKLEISWLLYKSCYCLLTHKGMHTIMHTHTHTRYVGFFSGWLPSFRFLDPQLVVLFPYVALDVATLQAGHHSVFVAFFCGEERAQIHSQTLFKTKWLAHSKLLLPNETFVLHKYQSYFEATVLRWVCECTLCSAVGGLLISHKPC